MGTWTAVLCSLFALQLAYQTSAMVYGGCETGTCTCTASTCGQNAQCSIRSIGGRPVCSCFRGYLGDPLHHCTRAECLDNSECRGHQTCQNGRCIDPCAGSCGANADCSARNHVPVCSCPAGYTGDPFSSCRRFDPSELCHPSPCGANTHCEVVNSVPTCKCLPGYQGSPLAGCRHECGTCGQNAQCSIIGGRPVCSCFRGYLGDPLHHCTRAECLDNSECRGHQTCQSGRCIDPCAGSCGANADCSARNHVPVCSCPAGYTGDPFSSCRRFDPSELCHPSPCGTNTHCEVVNSVPTCKCLPGYQGSPLAGCRHECDSDAECGSNLACIDFKCQNPCQTQCGENADCEIVRNHQAVCKCPKNYFGNPYTSCKPECYGDVDCPSGRPACFYGICKNPCDGVCGVGANCELRGLTPICSCPKDMTGDPFVSCRPFTPQDLCEPNPCGINARCEPGFETRNPSKERPVCFCLHGYTGDPIRGCQRGECTEDVHCPNSQACIDYKCQNPCIGGKCGANAQCSPRNHIAVCTCPTGYNGDALTQCNVVQTTSAARYIRYKRALEALFGNSTLVYSLV